MILISLVPQLYVSVGLHYALRILRKKNFNPFKATIGFFLIPCIQKYSFFYQKKGPRVIKEKIQGPKTERERSSKSLFLNNSLPVQMSLIRYHYCMPGLTILTIITQSSQSKRKNRPVASHSAAFKEVFFRGKTCEI